MRSSPKGSAERLTTPAEFFDFTRRLLVDARDKRNAVYLRRAAIRIDSPRFKQLPDSQQEDLLLLYGQAMAAGGALSP